MLMLSTIAAFLEADWSRPGETGAMRRLFAGTEVLEVKRMQSRAL